MMAMETFSKFSCHLEPNPMTEIENYRTKSSAQSVDCAISIWTDSLNGWRNLLADLPVGVAGVAGSNSTVLASSAILYSAGYWKP